MNEKRQSNLKRLFSPKSIAFIGGNSAAAAVEQCIRGGFDGEMWGVNPRRNDMAGKPCFASVADLPGAPDAVFLAVPSEFAIQTVLELREKNCGGIVSYTAGFGELGAEGHAQEQLLIEAAGHMAFVGPNCSGILNYARDAALWPFYHTGKSVEKGPAFITQSGMLGNTATMNDRSLDFAYIISAGNQGMLGVEDFLEFLIDDPCVTAIGMYIEGLRDVKRFAGAALRAMEAGIPIIAQKAGTSEMGAQLTVTHTGSLSGTDTLYQALFDRVGVIRVTSTVQMMETLKMVTVAGVPAGGRVAGLTCSGGDSTMLADGGEPLGLTFPQPSDAVGEDMKVHLPPIAAVGNPLDYTTPLWGFEEPLTHVFGAMFRDEYDAAIMVQDYPVPAASEAFEPYDADARAFITATREAGIPGVVCSILPEDIDEKTRRTLMDGGVAPLQGINDALGAIASAAKLGMRKAEVDDLDALQLLSPVPVGEDTSVLTEWEGKQSLKSSGVAVPDGRLVTAGDAVTAAAEIGYPVVVKLVSENLPHKTEAGAVHIGLKDAGAVEEAVSAISKSVAAYDPSVEIKDFLVEKMVGKPVAELLVGIRQDPSFGLVLVLGSGGTLVELVRDTVTLLLPTSRDDIATALLSLKVSILLDGFRGAAPADRDALVDAIAAMGEYAVKTRETLVELDVNPLMALEDGVAVADVLLRVMSPDT
jgi:acetate---CoA ligase (ADP-forming)